jgi:hypothetical protein
MGLGRVENATETHTSKLPINAPAMLVGGVKSPLAPIEPNSHTWGVTLAFKKVSIRQISSNRNPDRPRRWVLVRITIAARTSVLLSLHSIHLKLHPRWFLFYLYRTT